MSKNFTLEQLTEGIRQRHVGANNKRLVEKWSRTGLLRGLENHTRENMSTLLENQAAQLLREASSAGTGGTSPSKSGDLRGFTNIAFPIVRRVFGGLVANDLVSIQPMSLPSGLLFYLDYTYGSSAGGDSSNGTDGSNANTYKAGHSIYNLPTGKGVRSGSTATGGQYDLAGSGFSRVHKVASGTSLKVVGAGAWGTGATMTESRKLAVTGTDGKMLQFDPQVTTLIETDLENDSYDAAGIWEALVLDLTVMPTTMDLTMVKDIALHTDDVTATGLKALGADFQGGDGILNLRRLNQLGTFSGGVFSANPLVTQNTANAAVLMIVSGAYAKSVSTGITGNNTALSASYVVNATLSIDGDGSALTIPSFESDFSINPPTPVIPEIDIKIESIAVTAVTRKLRAKWSPELAQDLNAYHSLDAEVELTQILSEQIALEIDREILNDLLTEAQGANYYWSRAPGKFVNKESGAEQTLTSTLAAGPQFTGTVREWYETLTETIIDVANQIHRKTLRGSANFIVVGPDVATILEASVLYKPTYKLDGQGQVGASFSLGAEKVGSLSNRFTVYKDPYFPRNKILVGYKGGSYLESGYVYAPYVPLIVTPTIFAPEDFTPRKGVMTRYGKKMVRADFYGTVTCMDMNVI